MKINEEKRQARLERLAFIEPIIQAADAEIFRLREEIKPLRRELYVIREREIYRAFAELKPPKVVEKVPTAPSMTDYTDERKSGQRKTMTGRKHSEETKAKMRASHKHSLEPKAITTPYGEFESITSAAKHIGMTPACVYSKLKTNQEGWNYLNRPSAIANIPPMQSRKIPVISPVGVFYPTMTDAWKDTGMTLYLIQKSIANNTGWKRG